MLCALVNVNRSSILESTLTFLLGGPFGGITCCKVARRLFGSEAFAKQHPNFRHGT